MLDEAEAKKRLAGFGLDVPRHITVTAESLPDDLGFEYPVVLKAMGLAHKSDAGGVMIGLADRNSLESALAEMHQNQIGGTHYLIEEMITSPIAELLVGVVGDPVHGYLLTIAAGGILTELLQDSVSLTLPIQEKALDEALAKLKIAPLLYGYRGKEGVNLDALTKAVMAIQNYVIAHDKAVTEIEVNPLILTADRAVGVDALIRTGETSHV